MVFKKVISLSIIACLSILMVFQPVAPGIAQTETGKENPPITLDEAQKTLQQQRGFFTENKGQWDESILFIGKTDFGNIAFTQEAIYYQKIQVEEQEQDPLDPITPEDEAMLDPFYDRLDPMHREPILYSSSIIELSFVNAQNPQIEGLNPLPHYHNYMIGNDSSKWGIECRNFTQVTYTDLWEGIDLAYFFTPEGLKYEYYVHPHAQIQDLRIQVEGAELSPMETGLQMHTPLGTLKDDQLLVFGQTTQNTLSVSFKVENNTFSFAGIPTHRTETVVIDPLVYSTYLGGSRGYGEGENGETLPGGEYALDIAVDTHGNAYIIGITYSLDFPTTAGAFDRSHRGDQDVFVVKLNSSGTNLIYATYVGGSKYDTGYSMALDLSGNVYVAGRTSSSDFPMSSTVGGSSVPGYDQTFNAIHNPPYDAFVFKLNPWGTELIYSTYLGGSGYDRASSIAVDTNGHAYIAGYTRSIDFPMTKTIGGPPAPGYDQTHKGSYHGDAFVVKLNASGTELLYATFLGGGRTEYINSIAIDSFGNAYVAGSTTSSDFPMSTTVGGPPAPGYQKEYSKLYTGWQSSDAFVVKLNPKGTDIVYSTYLGGKENSRWADSANSIAVDDFGNLMLQVLHEMLIFL